MSPIRIALALSAAAAAASCSGTYDFRSEGWSKYYERPAEETVGPTRVDRKAIVHWADNPKNKKRVGFLHKYEVQPKGSRDVRECYYITDSAGITHVGFVTAEGVFYRFDKNGRLEEPAVGEYKIITTGLKKFYGIPLRENLDVEDIDPYK
jgi:hypothetical protein